MRNEFELYLLDEQMRPLYVIDTWVSFIWENSFSVKGIFDIYLPSDTELTRALNGACYIYKTDDRRGGYIETKNTQIESAKGDMTVITGYLLEGITYKFNLTSGIISGKEGDEVNAPNSLAAAFNCFRDFGVNNAAVDSPVDFYFYIVESEYRDRGYPNLGELCYTILPGNGYTLVAEIDLESALIVFKFRPERDRTFGTAEPVTVSAGMDSLNNIKYIYSEASCFNVILIYAKYPSSLSADWKRWSAPPAGGHDFLYNPENLTGVKVNYRIIPVDVITKKIWVWIMQGEEEVREERTVPDNQATAEFFRKKALEYYSPFSESFSGEMTDEVVAGLDLRYGDVVTLKDDARGETYNVRVEKEVLSLSASKILHSFALGTPLKNLKEEVSNLERKVF